MECIDYEYRNDKPGGIGKVILGATTMPETMPQTTEGIKGLPDVGAPYPNIEPWSLLIIADTGKVYIRNEAGTDWVEFGGVTE